jgi:hypothetical protein
MKFITTGLIVSLSIAVTARGDVVLDQQHSFTSSIANSTNGDVTQVGQTFTVGVAGTLDHIEVLMFRLSGIFDPTGDPLLRVFNTAAGLPTGAPLATVTIPEANVPLNTAAFVSFDLSSAEIGLNIGEILAFSVTATSGVGPYFLLTDQGLSVEYAGGAAIAKFGDNPWQQLSPPQDHGFKTYVLADVAEDLDGDYNDDGLVDTADFVVWQKFNGTSTDLPNDPNPLPIDNDQYTTWQTHFGESNAGAGGADRSTAVPEPSNWWLLYVVTAFGGSGSNGRRRQ